MIAQTFRRSRIMIVDDEPAMVRLLEQLLERAGYTHLRSTTDPREVPTHYREFRPDLIMLRSEEHTSELQSQSNLVCRLLLEKKKKKKKQRQETTISNTSYNCIKST